MERWCPELRRLVPQSRHSLRHAQRSVVMGKDNNVYEFTQNCKDADFLQTDL